MSEMSELPTRALLDAERRMRERAEERVLVLEERLAAYEAGQEISSVPEGTRPTPGQAWFGLLRMDREKRIDILATLLEDSGAASMCLVMDHAGASQRADEMFMEVQKLRSQNIRQFKEFMEVMATVCHANGGQVKIPRASIEAVDANAQLAVFEDMEDGSMVYRYVSGREAASHAD